MTAHYIPTASTQLQLQHFKDISERSTLRIYLYLYYIIHQPVNKPQQKAMKKVNQDF